MGVKSANDIRREFLEFFQGKAHTIVPSSPVVPHDDPTLMFANAGMNQFKPIFLGQRTPDVDKWPGVTPASPTRAANTQKCIRAGGKHNDLDDVGHDTYHHTLFEMLGNWSFGDYFKKEAIAWAWELLTKVWGIDKRRLHATYFQGDEADGLPPDSDAAELWRTVSDIDPANIHPGNKKDNFWEMGDTGPCGPCSEIHIDLTPDMSGGSRVNAGDARVMEIWNLVFIQFNRDAAGKLSPLPAKHIDTGMGFERITAVLQGKKSNYDTDVFAPIFAGIQRVTNAPEYTGLLEEQSGAPSEMVGTAHPTDSSLITHHSSLYKDIAYRVIADHIRTLTFALTDGAVPSNEGRGYVLRRILRRAVRYGRQYLNVHEPFLCKLVPVVVDAMGHAFPELTNKPQRVVEIIKDEEESFDKTLDRGIDLFLSYVGLAFFLAFGDSVLAGFIDSDLRCNFRSTNKAEIEEAALCEPNAPNYFRPNGRLLITRAPSDIIEEVMLRDLSSATVLKYCKSPPVISGEAAFKLHDTYGFPIDLTEVMARERGMTVDTETYERLMEEARERARGVTSEEDARRSQEEAERISQLPLGVCDDYAKYAEWMKCAGRIVGYARNTAPGDKDPAKAGEHIVFSLNRTCFYAEQGGQVSDQGWLRTDTGKMTVQKVSRIPSRMGNVVIDRLPHHGVVTEGEIWLAQDCEMGVDPARRLPTMSNHTATHVLNWALREVLELHGGGKVDQKGSLVDPEKTRFDFSHNKPLTHEEIGRIETLCREQIGANHTVYTKEVDQKAALRINTLRAVFGEKYPDVVRVVSIGADIDELLRTPDDPAWMKYSVEFCGGTHVAATADIGAFALVAEESVAKGVRRVVGVSGEKARTAIARGAELRKKAASIKAGKPDDVAAGVAELQKELAEAEIPVLDRHAIREAIAELQQIVKQQGKQQSAESAGAVREARKTLLTSAERAGSVVVAVGELPEAPVEHIREAADWLRTEAGSAAVLLGSANDGKPLLIAAMTDDLIKKGLKAGDLIKHVVPHIEGRGGGKPDLAQAGGTKVEGIPAALEAGRAWIREKLGAG